MSSQDVKAGFTWTDRQSGLTALRICIDSQAAQLLCISISHEQHLRESGAQLCSEKPKFSTITTLLYFIFFFGKHLIFSLSCQKTVELLWMTGKSILILQFAASAKNLIAFVCSKLPLNLWPAGWYCEGENGPFFLSLFYYFHSTLFLLPIPTWNSKILVLHHNTW